VSRASDCCVACVEAVSMVGECQYGELTFVGCPLCTGTQLGCVCNHNPGIRFMSTVPAIVQEFRPHEFKHSETSMWLRVHMHPPTILTI
jgi:hypothetical protein